MLGPMLELHLEGSCHHWGLRFFHLAVLVAAFVHTSDSWGEKGYLGSGNSSAARQAGHIEFTILQDQHFHSRVFICISYTRIAIRHLCQNCEVPQTNYTIQGPFITSGLMFNFIPNSTSTRSTFVKTQINSSRYCIKTPPHQQPPPKPWAQSTEDSKTAPRDQTWP